MSNEIKVTKEDIDYAEKILFNKNNIFDEHERLPIIKNFNESFDVNACPGSGKTTVLLAKLIVLSRKMPLNNGQGICVLTHTNVAIDEIKNKLGDKSDILFKYPNFFGTIQSFIDTYLAIPYFKRQTGENIKSIDDDIYRNHISRLSSGYYPHIKRTIEYCEEQRIGNFRLGRYTEDFINFIVNKHYKFINDNQVICKWSGASLEEKNYYSELYKIMFANSFAEGILRYEDAYVLADRYLSKFTNLRSFFSERFRYVFIDEMQDTKEGQEKVLEKIFDKEKVIIQRFGDINQNIGLSSTEKSGWILSDNVKYINSSKRYGKTMVKFLSQLRVHSEGQLEGNGEIKTLVPHIIIFNDSNIQDVIGKFIDVLKAYHINEMEGNIKVIGKLGIDVKWPNITIKSYTNRYKKNSKSDVFSKKVSCKFRSCKDLKSFYDNLLSVIVLSLDQSGKKVNKDQFKRVMEKERNNEFILYKASIKKWFLNINKDYFNVIKDIFNVTSILLNKLTEYNFDETVLRTCLLSDSEELDSKEEVAASNQCNDEHIISDINTVFGVKGETHLATLYLESRFIQTNGDNLRSDIMKILDYMVGKKSTVNPKDEEALIAAYVAMSRAQKLTCIAISYDTIQGRIKEFMEYGYQIIPCDDKIEELVKKEI